MRGRGSLNIHSFRWWIVLHITRDNRRTDSNKNKWLATRPRVWHQQASEHEQANTKLLATRPRVWHQRANITGTRLINGIDGGGAVRSSSLVLQKLPIEWSSPIQCRPTAPTVHTGVGTLPALVRWRHGSQLQHFVCSTTESSRLTILLPLVGCPSGSDARHRICELF